MTKITQAFMFFKMVFLTITLNAQTQVVELQNQSEKIDQLMRDFNARNDYHQPTDDFIGLETNKNKSAIKKFAAEKIGGQSKLIKNSISTHWENRMDVNKDLSTFYRNSSIKEKRRESDVHVNRISW